MLNGWYCMPVDRRTVAVGADRQDRLRHPVGTPVAVVHRVAEQPAVRVEQPVVDRPGVDPDAVERGVRPRAEPVEDAVVEGQRRPSAACRATRTGWLANRAPRPAPACPARPAPSITRPLDAPRSTAATLHRDRMRVIAGTRRRTPGVDRDVQSGGVRQVAGGQGEDRVRHVLGQHLAFEQRALRVEGAELGLRDAVDGRALGAPAAGEDAGTADHAVGVDAVDPDAVLAQLGGEQPDLVRLVGLGRAVGDVVRPGEDASSCWRCRRCRRRCPCAIMTRAASRATRNEPLAITSCCTSQSASTGLQQRLGDGQPGVVDDQVHARRTRAPPPATAAASRPRR